MAEYLIQEETMTALANQARRLSNNAKTLNAAEIAEVFSRVQGSLNENGDYSVKCMDNDGDVIKSGMYDTGEIFALPSPPQIRPEWKFKEWVGTSSVPSNFITIEDKSIDIGAIYNNIDNAMIYYLNITQDNGLTVNFQNLNKPHTIDWGDGVIDTLNSVGYVNCTHTYSNYGLYTVKMYGITNLVNANVMWADEETALSINGASIPDSCIVYDSSKLIPNNASFLNVAGTWEEITSGLGGNSNIEALVLPNGVRTLGGSAFGKCSNLRTIILPNTISSIEDGWNEVGCFANCASLNSIVLPDSLIELGKNAFYNCTNLKSVWISEGITEIKTDTFYNCTSLTDVHIPSSVTSIRTYAFACDDSNVATTNFSLNKLVLPSVTSIELCAFRGLNNLRTVVLGANNVCSIVYKANYQDNADYSNISFYVPDELVGAYKTTDCWSKLVDNIKPVSEYMATA